jgi:formylglycine-generating enzyme required for sulfatase activity
VTGSDTVEIRVFAIEMIYVPQGDFFAGDNATSFNAFKQGSTDTDPWWIGSEGAMSVTNTTGNMTGTGEKVAVYYYPGDGDAAGSVFTIPAPFPKGYQAHYMMKGEISQGQWVAFFNTLTATQKSTLDITSSTGKNSDNLTYRNNVSWSSGDATLPDRGSGATYEAVAMNYISWADLTAYLDWSGLRPMSELEFERAGRGPYRAVSGEYAWGSTSITQATSISNSGLPSERAQSGANAAYGNHASVRGPLRVGSFAYGVATRIASGGGYYGAMELSGNLYERPVTVGNSTGRSFEGRYHGNGALDSSGNPNVSTWPGTGATGSGLRGGDWFHISAAARLSDRNSPTLADTARGLHYGGRGVRVAP